MTSSYSNRMALTFSTPLSSFLCSKCLTRCSAPTPVWAHSLPSLPESGTPLIIPPPPPPPVSHLSLQGKKGVKELTGKEENRQKRGSLTGSGCLSFPWGVRSQLVTGTSTTEVNRAGTVAAPPRQCLYSWIQLCLNKSSSRLSTLSAHQLVPSGVHRNLSAPAPAPDLRVPN